VYPPADQKNFGGKLDTNGVTYITVVVKGTVAAARRYWEAMGIGHVIDVFQSKFPAHKFVE
jgi:hypothetical protein